MYDDYSYNIYEHTERQLGKSCDEARWDLLAAEGGGSINLNIGAVFYGSYGPIPLESIGCASGKFDHLCDVLETMVPDNRVIDSVKFHHFLIKSDEMINKVESAIKTKHIKELEFERCFDYNHPSRKGIDLVSRLLEGNQNLEKLTVDVGILNTNFTNALRDHPTLETLDLANFDFGFRDEQFEALMEAVKDKSDVSIRHEGHSDCNLEIAHLITPVLATNPQLQKLRLRGVELLNRRRARPGEDEYAILKSFARALSTNSNLKQLTLDGIRWEEQTQILLRAIYDDSSLNTLAMSDHTCQIFIDDGNSNPTFKSISEDYKWIQGGETSIARKSKLLCAIGTFDESCIDVKRVSEGPSELLPKLIPMMLEFVQGVHIFEQIDNAKLERLAFKNVYELMRNIVAPSLLPTHDPHDIQTCGLKRKRDVAGAEN
ncbi:hypothetical protein QTG54_006874 [Skeletonema marinoi]|uniref:Uncharacterized protein n=1 Tax=Skeletonema marinoi TaxID=267567 RepID=A0AAD8YB28_9STRA|nr:hypothetical protein QTG54_006874 [Skeletonema marinoi]